MNNKILILVVLLVLLLATFIGSKSYNGAFPVHYAYRTPIGEESENYLTEDQQTYEGDYNEGDQDEYVQDYDSEYMEFENGEEEEPLEDAETLSAVTITPVKSTNAPIRPVVSHTPPATPQPIKPAATMAPIPQKSVSPPTPVSSSHAPVVPPTQANRTSHNETTSSPTICLPTQTLTQTTGANGTIIKSCVEIPPAVSLTCKSYGDPHITSFSGVQFDFYSEGQYTYVRSINNDFAVFGRMRSWDDGNVQTAVTVQVNSKDTYTFDAEKFILYYKTTPIPFNPSETFALHAVNDSSMIYYKPNKRIVFDTNSGAKVLLTFHSNKNTNSSLPNARSSFINLEIVVPTTMKLRDGFCMSTDQVQKTIPTAEQFKDATFPRDGVEPTKVNSAQTKWASEDARKRAKAACSALFKDGSRAFKACVRDFKRSKAEADGHFMAKATKEFIESKNRFEKRISNGKRFEDKNAKILNTNQLIDIQKADREYEELKQQALAHITPRNSTAPH